jgi:hypothetical protein
LPVYFLPITNMSAVKTLAQDIQDMQDAAEEYSQALVDWSDAVESYIDNISK